MAKKVMTLTVTLSRPAKKKGGDRYETRMPDNDIFTTWLPQSVSRQGGDIVPMFKIVYYPLDEDGNPLEEEE